LDIPDVDIDLNDDSPKGKETGAPLQTANKTAEPILFGGEDAFVIPTEDDDNQQPEFNFFEEPK
jgi:hypothetical protein